jgi:hypothetical protein
MNKKDKRRKNKIINSFETVLNTWLSKKSDSDIKCASDIEEPKENIFGNSILKEIIFLHQKRRAIKTGAHNENTLLVLSSALVQKEILTAKINVLNKILLHLP